MNTNEESTGKVNALSFLTDLEKDSLSAFVQNEVMKEALRKVLLDQMLNMGVQRKGEKTLANRNWVFGLDQTGKMTDDQFGRAIRVHTEAIVLLEQAYAKLNDLRPEEKEVTVKNRAL